MSRIVRYKTQVTSFPAAEAAVKVLGIEISQQQQSGFSVYWKTSWGRGVVHFKPDGEVAFDSDYGMSTLLQRFQQQYVVESAKLAACAQGFQYQEIMLEDGSINLDIYLPEYA